MYLNIYFTIDSNYGVKTVSNPPTKCTREIHTRAHNSQMHTRDPHACTQSRNARERSTHISDRSSKRKKEKKKNI